MIKKIRQFDWFVLYEAYRRIPSWIRLSVALIICALGPWMCVHSYNEHHAWVAKQAGHGPVDPLKERAKQGGFKVGLFVTLVGIALLVTSGRTEAEKNGYRF